MKIQQFDNKGKKKDTKYDFGKVFDIEPNLDLISQYNYIYLSNQRYANAKAKDRSEVRGGGRKPWKQKGTGRARSGSSRSPIWRSGGVTFGPTGEQNYKKVMPKKMKALAFKSIMALKGAEKEMVVVEDFDTRKTADAIRFINNLGLDARKYLIVQTDDSKLHFAFNNVANVSVVRAGEVNTYDVLNGGMIIILKSVADQLKKQA